MIGARLFADDPRAARHRRVLALLVLLLLAAVGANAVRRACKGKSSRYDENVAYSRALVYEGVRVYHEYPASATHTKYPPFYFVYVAPFVPLPTALGASLWYLLNLAMAIATVVMAVRMAWPVGAAKPPTLHAYALLAGLMGWIAITNMSTSQVNIQIGFFVVLGLYLIRRGREESGGFALMVATMLKVTPALLLVWLLVRGRWKAIRGAAIGFIALWFLVGLVLGGDEALDATRGWIEVMIPYARDGVLAEGIAGVRSTNQSLAAGIYRFFTDSPADTQIENLRVNVLALAHGTAGTIVRVLNVLLLLVVAWMLGRGPVHARSDRFTREAALLMTLMVVISPISWINHHIALILPYAVALQVFRDEPEGRWTRRKALFAAASLLTLLGAPCRLLLAFSLPLIGALLLGVLLTRTLREKPTTASA